MPKFRCPKGFRQDPPKSKKCVKKEDVENKKSSSSSKTRKKSISKTPTKYYSVPSPTVLTPKEPSPKEPSPKEPTPKEPTPKEPSPKQEIVWTKVYSHKHKKHYWLNEKTGQKAWYNPVVPVTTYNPVVPVVPGQTEKKDKKPFIAIIVPFRDLHAAQERQKHLDRFIPEISNFLKKSNKPFRIYIIEQSMDDRKFNRGKLLNAGFELAKKDGAQVFIFHDVDLIPSDNLIHYYSNIPRNPTHIAKVWKRYNYNTYFGGVVAFSKHQFETINGYPNNFWGWGGEDDELGMRVRDAKMRIDFPKQGTFIDMENMNIDEKIKYLKENATIKCMNKNEVLQEHKDTWKTNGLSNLDYDIIKKTPLSENAVKYTIDTKLNQHWTDQRCMLNVIMYGK